VSLGFAHPEPVEGRPVPLIPSPSKDGPAHPVPVAGRVGDRPLRRTAARRLARAALLALVTAGAAAPVTAAEPLPARLTVENGNLEAAVELGAAFPASMERQLGNGLTNVIAVYVSVVPEGSGRPVAIHGRIIEILFDVWDETYAVTVKDPTTPRGVRRMVNDFAALRALLAQARDLELGPVAELPAGPFRLEARVEVNPVSKELLQRTREYIANPPAGARPGGSSRSVLGAMASFLLREPDAGSASRLFRSRTFTRTEVAAR
jgi:hypothetical protein